MFLFVKRMFTVLHFRERSLPREGKLNKDRQAVKRATALSDVAVYAPHHTHTKHTHAHRHCKHANTHKNGMHIFLAQTHTHTHIRAVTQTDTHPEQQTAGPCLRSRRSMDLQRGESKRFEAYVKSLRIQNKALSRTLCLGPGSPLPAPLCSACGGRRNPPSPRRNPSSSLHVVPFFAPTDCHGLPPTTTTTSERLPQICLRG